jgi:putative transcriptional regulator
VWLFLYLSKEQKSSKWLAEQLGKDRATVSKWVTNTMQPDARNLLRIAEALNIDAGRLLNQKHLNNEGNRYYPTDKTWRGQ